MKPVFHFRTGFQLQIARNEAHISIIRGGERGGEGEARTRNCAPNFGRPHPRMMEKKAAYQGIDKSAMAALVGVAQATSCMATESCVWLVLAREYAYPIGRSWYFLQPLHIISWLKRNSRGGIGYYRETAPRWQCSSMRSCPAQK